MIFSYILSKLSFLNYVHVRIPLPTPQFAIGLFGIHNGLKMHLIFYWFLQWQACRVELDGRTWDWTCTSDHMESLAAHMFLFQNGQFKE